MQIIVFGTGYVGLVTGVCLAEIGHDILCIDTNQQKIDQLKSGISPIYEPGIEEKLKHSLNLGKLRFANNLDRVDEMTEALFICVGTPDDGSGKTNLEYVYSVADDIAEVINKSVPIFIKSTVPVGTCKILEDRINKKLISLRKKFQISVSSNPEFLKEGDAISDFLKPDRIIIGTNDDESFQIAQQIYQSFHRSNYRIIRMDPNSSEMTKYASNAFLATKISFMNQLSHLCDATGSDIDQIRSGMSLDPRIGKRFLYAGCGFGGSCFPKDIHSLISQSRELSVDLSILNEVLRSNEFQKNFFVEKVKELYGEDLKGQTFAIWGAAFKPETDDIREAPSLTIISSLIDLGATVNVYDPIAIDNLRDYFGDEDLLNYFNHFEEAAKGSEAVILVTEWKEFTNPDFDLLLKKMKGNTFFDGRNIYDPDLMANKGFRYFSIGRNDGR